MNKEDAELVETLRREGIGVMRGLLTEGEVEEARAAFDQAHRDAGKQKGKPGVRDRLSGERLFAYPVLVGLYTHPRILAVVSQMLDESVPWVWQLITNRYNPEHVGVRKHTDGFLKEFAPPFTRQAMAVFLDDIDASSGALTYVPGTHLLHFEDTDAPDRRPPTQEDIDGGHYVPVTLSAGDVVFRVPEVWHAVIPIHRLRRYVTASYNVRGRLSPEMERRVAEEKVRREAEGLDTVPELLRPYWSE